MIYPNIEEAQTAIEQVEQLMCTLGLDVEVDDPYCAASFVANYYDESGTQRTLCV